MNTPSPFPPDSHPLKLPRRTAEPAAEDRAAEDARWQLEADLAALREREANLRGYEARLRAWQDQLDAAVRMPTGPRTVPTVPAATSSTPLPDEYELRVAWEKLHRARALLEAEQRQMRDDRLALRDAREELQRQEAALVAREAAVAQREQQLLAAPTLAVEQAEKPESAVRRWTQAPFQAARAVFRKN